MRCVKEINEYKQKWKEAKAFFLETTTLYIKDGKDASRKFQQLTNTFRKVAGYKINR